MSDNGEDMPGEIELAAMEVQTRRAVEIAAALKFGWADRQSG